MAPALGVLALDLLCDLLSLEDWSFNAWGLVPVVLDCCLDAGFACVEDVRRSLSLADNWALVSPKKSSAMPS